MVTGSFKLEFDDDVTGTKFPTYATSLNLLLLFAF